MSTGENAGGYPCDRLASHPVGGGGGGGGRGGEMLLVASYYGKRR